MRSSAAVALLIGARCFVEAVTFSALAALGHAIASGRDPLPVLPTALVLFGVGLVLVTVLREAGAERRSAAILVITLAVAAAWGLSLPMKANVDWFATLSRVVLFALLGEIYLWRIVSIARGAMRWTDARNAAPFAGLAIAAASLAPGPIDRAPFAALALLGVAASGLALSLARTSEELSLSRGTTGSVRASSATGATVIVGVAAIIAAAFVPSVQDAFGAFGSFVAPIAGRIFYLLILPFAYLAGFLIQFLRPFVARNFPQLAPPQVPALEDEEMLRQIEQTRPFVFGAVELIIVAIAVLFAIVLLDRMLRERRMELPEGVTLEREGTEGLSLMDTLRGLRPRVPARRRRPRDDGTPAGALRVLYWRFLDLAERHGPGWRETYETPAEHEGRAVARDASWRESEPLVRAFEDLRYGEREPDADTVARSRDALGKLEAATRGS
ncbi:MAG TPA: DUF4129 domain-containing protein [Methylomirabilota bacterium]|nr:DUF4129 domain-containing protein [Methylomirabilota bacterium]